jgi:glucose-6-phosphate 1-dehydrogenase
MRVTRSRILMPARLPDPTVHRIVILGATGDLARRYLLPALAELYASDALSRTPEIVAVGRRDLTLDEYWDGTALETEDAKPGIDPRTVLGPHLRYAAADIADAPALQAIVGADPVIVYLALPPTVFGPAIGALAEAGIHPDTRLVVEKPFGTDLASARELNELVHRGFDERNVYRIDHFLHHQTVQNIVGLRFANRFFEPLWRAEHIEAVDIVWDETLGLEGRAGYYDGAGALRDMIQNHLLQLLALVAMEPPARLDERTLRDAKVAVLRAVRTLDPAEVAARTVRGRYMAGTVGGRRLPDYLAEPGVDPSGLTETFAQVELAIDTWRWAGVPFRLRTGKALGEGRRFVEVRFRPVPHEVFEGDAPRPNFLRLELRPDRIVLGLAVNGPGDPLTLEQSELHVEFPPQSLPAYARLLLDVLRGDAMLSIRDDEAEECWRIVEPILATWRSGTPTLVGYPAGSRGPAAPLRAGDPS